MSKCRGLDQQGEYAISHQKAIGEKKYVAFMSIKEERLYSYARCDGVRNVCSQLMRFIADIYPEIKWVRDIMPEHTTAWLKTKRNISEETFHEYRSCLSKLQNVCEATYGKCRKPGNWGTVSIRPPKTGKTRNVVMKQTDFECIRDSIRQGGRSGAWIAMEITARTGLRVRECHWLSGKDINLEKNSVFVCKRGAKNGRARTIPIRPQDQEFFKWLKDRTPNDRIFRMRNGKVLAPESIDSTIRRHMKKLGLDTKYPKSSLHSIRKMYAQERMEELRGPLPLSDRDAEMKMFDIVSGELGHGKNRTDLYKVYVLGK